MTSQSRPSGPVVLPQWIAPLAQWWKPLIWLWGFLVGGLCINVGSSWLTTKTLDLNGTPLGWLLDHPWITLPVLFLLISVTLLAGLVSLQENLTSPAISLSLTTKLRQQLLEGLEREYRARLNSSLQGKVMLELQLQERADIIASSASLVFYQLETGVVSTLSPGTSIIEAYDQARRGLLLLGAPGSGKTTLLLSLAQALLQRALSDSDHPLVIVLNLSSWASKQPSLEQWLGEQCSLVYGISRKLTAFLIEQEQIQFVLDGLDEVGSAARTACIEAINGYRQRHLIPLVVGSRSQEYEVQTARLILPVAVEIQPLAASQVSLVLRQAGKTLAPVRTAIRNNPVLGELLTTPLMVSIVLLTYAGKTAKAPPQQGSLEEQQHILFEQYVERMLRRYQPSRRVSIPQTTFSLAWLAHQMQDRHLTELHLETLQSDWLNSTRLQITHQLVTGLLFGLLLGLFGGLAIGLLLGLFAGLFFGLIFGLLVWGLGEQKITLAQTLTWSWKESWIGLPFGLLVGLPFGLLFGLFSGLLGGLLFGLLSGLLFGLVFGLLSGISESSLTGPGHLKPNQDIHSSGWNALRFGLTFGIFFGLIFGQLGYHHGGLFFGLLGGLFGGLFFGLLVGLLGGGNAYVQHYLLRWWLASQCELPWRTVPFLEEATRCVLLQRVGGGYRFIHPLLQAYFASLTPPFP